MRLPAESMGRSGMEGRCYWQDVGCVHLGAVLDACKDEWVIGVGCSYVEGRVGNGHSCGEELGRRRDGGALVRGIGLIWHMICLWRERASEGLLVVALSVSGGGDCGSLIRSTVGAIADRSLHCVCCRWAVWVRTGVCAANGVWGREGAPNIHYPGLEVKPGLLGLHRRLSVASTGSSGSSRLSR
jgi:hypothetical protein